MWHQRVGTFGTLISSVHFTRLVSENWDNAAMGHRQAGRAGMPSISSHSEAVLYHTESHHINVSSILGVCAVFGAANNKLFDYKCTEYFIYSSESCEWRFNEWDVQRQNWDISWKICKQRRSCRHQLHNSLFSSRIVRSRTDLDGSVLSFSSAHSNCV